MQNFIFYSSIESINPIYIWVMYAVAFIYLYFALPKQKMSFIGHFFVLVSLDGVVEYISDFYIRIYDLLIFLLLVYNILVRRSGKVQTSSVILFVFFTTSYILMSSMHNFKDPLSDLRQYIIYAIPFLVFILFAKVRHYIDYISEIEVIIVILKMQIIAAVLKIFLIGFNEKIVGTMSILSGGVAAIFPIIFFLVFWYHKRGLVGKIDWFWILSSLIVAISSNKRAIWFYFPITVFIFLIAFKKIQLNIRIFGVISLIFFLFYFGVKFNPSLNQESVMWGSFNLEYVTDYVINYNLGTTDRIVNNQFALGRIGSNMFYLNLLTNDLFSFNNFFGYGNADFNDTEAHGIQNITKFGFESKYMLTGWVKMLIQFGFFVLAIVLFSIYRMIRIIRNKRDFLLFNLIFYSWFIFYSGVLLTELLPLTCFIFMIFYVQYYNRLVIPSINNTPMQDICKTI